jgi:dephospho-CoA kinase
MKSQMNVQQALRRADFIVANDGSVEDLERQVTFLDSLLQKLARA